MQPGHRVRVEMTKWVDRPHWCFDAVHLGSDEHGRWLGLPAGTPLARPGVETHAALPQVVLVPPTPGGPGSGGIGSRAALLAGLDPEVGWIATFHPAGAPLSVYVDIVTPPVWDGTVLRAVDLDLDVVRSPGGRVWVDDEDEFADHRVRWDYPADLVSHAAVSCEFVQSALRERVAPYDDTAAPWFDVLADLLSPADVAPGTGRPTADRPVASPVSPPPA
ncbi:DUF402 domain-containing protein [Nocardioides limicola]|uniref:DUF402 domain-containing protein n=1 Tax=Nocardioides limicola TaxID=2803368 RepID=UPI00193C2768|nr:DUF402 domain-containing protein [Nocardioides sp. DJM-14]